MVRHLNGVWSPGPRALRQQAHIKIYSPGPSFQNKRVFQFIREALSPEEVKEVAGLNQSGRMYRKSVLGPNSDSSYWERGAESASGPVGKLRLQGAGAGYLIRYQAVCSLGDLSGRKRIRKQGPRIELLMVS